VTRHAPSVGQRTELARYAVSSGERVLYGQRIDGRVRITDRPVSGGGRSYLVEREVERDGYASLKALIGDYTRQALELDAVPMATRLLRQTIGLEAAVQLDLASRRSRRHMSCRPFAPSVSCLTFHGDDGR
jgi:hypothetical protein